jgi:hypothetical protein
MDSHQLLTRHPGPPMERIPNIVCYRAIENQNVPMMFLVAAR